MKDLDIYFVVSVSGIGEVGVYSHINNAIYTIKKMLFTYPWADISIKSEMLDKNEYEDYLTNTEINREFLEGTNWTELLK